MSYSWRPLLHAGSDFDSPLCRLFVKSELFKLDDPKILFIYKMSMQNSKISVHDSCGYLAFLYHFFNNQIQLSYLPIDHA